MRCTRGHDLVLDEASRVFLHPNRLWRVKGKAMQRVLRREAALEAAQRSGRVGYGESRLAAQARLLLRRLGRLG